MSRSETAKWLLRLAVVIGSFLVLGGCKSTDSPQVTGLVSRNYEENFTVQAGVEKLYVLVGTTEYGGSDRPATVTLDPEPVSGELLQFSIRVVGVTLGTEPRAITGYRWSGDTLRVWCGYESPAAWGGAEKSSGSDPWQPPYLIPREVSIGSPADVEVQYLGLWYE